MQILNDFAQHSYVFNWKQVLNTSTLAQLLKLAAIKHESLHRQSKIDSFLGLLLQVMLIMIFWN